MERGSNHRGLWLLNLVMSCALVIGIYFWLRPYGAALGVFVGGLIGIPAIGWCVLTLLWGEPDDT